MSADINKLSERIKLICSEEGFTKTGITSYRKLFKETDYLTQWINDGKNADMNWMSKSIGKRNDPNLVLEEVKSIISLAYIYDTPFRHEERLPKISRYAWGKDYHLIIWSMLNELELELKKVDPAFKSISYVDTGPVMDKAWAVRSGIGWLGKHTNVINREIGSWFFIANTITNYDFNYSDPIPDFCGTCTACIDACPTNAIVQEYVVDANKCISYLTIENKSEISAEFKGKFDNWLFGCDICQDVCPWNQKFPVETLIIDFHPQNKELTLNEVIEMNEEEFKEKFKISPVKRGKLTGMKRNALFLKKN